MMGGASGDVGSRVLDRQPRLANQQVQLTRIETSLAIVLSSQLESGKSILVSSNAAVTANVHASCSHVPCRHGSECPAWRLGDLSERR